jgi:hypothetical protein
MAEHAPQRVRSGIDIPKTLAGTLAAVSAAVVGSFLGVAGTLVGAAVASIVGSVGTELYHRWIDRGSQKLKSTFVTAPAAMGTPSVAAAEHESPSEPEPERVPIKIRWGRAAMVAGALFVLAMGSLTAFELISGEPAANALGGDSSKSGTTLGAVLSGNSQRQSTPTPAPSGSAPASDAPGGTGETPATDQPTDSPQSTATPTPTVTPNSGDTATEAPTQAPAGGSTDGGTGNTGTGDSGTGDTGGSTGGDAGGTTNLDQENQPDNP